MQLSKQKVFQKSFESDDALDCGSYRIILKPRPHQQQCRSNIVECYKSIDSFDKVETNWTHLQFVATLLKERNFCEKRVRYCCRFWRQSRTLLRHCCWCGRGLSMRLAFCGLETRSLARVGPSVVPKKNFFALCYNSYLALHAIW